MARSMSGAEEDSNASFCGYIGDPLSSGVNSNSGGDGDAMSFGSGLSGATGGEGSVGGDDSDDDSDFDLDDDTGVRSDDEMLSSAECDSDSSSSGGVDYALCSYIHMLTKHEMAPSELSFSGRCNARSLPRWRELLQLMNAPDAPEPPSEKWIFACVDLPQEVMQALLPTLTSRKIHYLVLRDNGFGSRGVRFLSEVLENGSRIQEIVFAHNPIDSMQDASRLVSALGNNSTLKWFTLTGLNLERDWGVLFMILRKCQNITTLDLENNCIGRKGAEVISEYLREDPPLEQLSLCQNAMDEDDLATLLRALKGNTTLIYLGLSDATITPALGRIVDQTLFDISSLNAVSDSNHTCELNTNWSSNSPMSVLAGERGWANVKLDDNETGGTIRKYKLFAVLCAVYMREGLGGIMKGIDLELMPRLLALVQQNLVNVHFGLKDFVTFNMDQLLLSDSSRDFPWRGANWSAGRTYYGDDASADDSSYGSNEDVHFPEDDVFSFYSDSEDSDAYLSNSWTRYMVFDLTLAFEILRRYTAPMLASANKGQMKVEKMREQC